MVDNALPRIQEIAGKIGPALVSAISGAIGSISPEWAGIFDRVSDGADKVAAGFGSIIEHAEATGVLDDFATAIYNVADAVSSADFTEFFEMISNCFKGLTDFYGELKQIESDKIVDAGGALPEILDPDTWNMALDSSGAFRKGLEDMGVTTREYGRVSASTQRQVAQEFARNGGDIVAALASAGLEVDKTTGKIDKSFAGSAQISTTSVKCICSFPDGTSALTVATKVYADHDTDRFKLFTVSGDKATAVTYTFDGRAFYKARAFIADYN